ncbi:DUF6728 family protein [Olivibacter ginsenosidimutans]
MYFSKKKDPSAPKKSFNLRVMHTINKIAITLFILGVLYKLILWIFFKN